jgi:hypothetical protein
MAIGKNSKPQHYGSSRTSKCLQRLYQSASRDEQGSTGGIANKMAACNGRYHDVLKVIKIKAMCATGVCATSVYNKFIWVRKIAFVYGGFLVGRGQAW